MLRAMMPSKALAKNVSSTILALGLIAQATEDTHGEPDHRAQLHTYNSHAQ
jgi:hypothetical protein